MNNALIGHTGFVGGNLLEQGNFSATFNSKTIERMRNTSFDTVWCAGVRAVKWWANQHPKEDWQEILLLLNVLKTVQCKQFILFSTVDVFTDSVNVDEHTKPSKEKLHTYGLHRLIIEDFVCKHFSNVLIVRLPGLYGIGLKKNAIYDFLHQNQMEKIHADSSFQFYDLSTIYKDSQIALAAEINCCHFAVEPFTIGEMAQEVFKKEFSNRPSGIMPARYNMLTCYANFWSHTGSYIQSKGEALERLRQFIFAERKRCVCE